MNMAGEGGVWPLGRASGGWQQARSGAQWCARGSAARPARGAFATAARGRVQTTSQALPLNKAVALPSAKRHLGDPRGAGRPRRIAFLPSANSGRTRLCQCGCHCPVPMQRGPGCARVDATASANAERARLCQCRDATAQMDLRVLFRINTSHRPKGPQRPHRPASQPGLHPSRYPS